MQVIALRPVVGHGGIGSHGAHNGYQDHGQQAAGEAHVIEVHAVLDFVCIGGEGRQHKADEQSHGDTPPQVAEAVVQRHITHHRGQGCGQQGHGDILAERLPPRLGVQEGPGDDGPDVDNVLAEQGKASHQAQLHQCEAVGRLLAQVEQQQAHQRHQGGVDQGRAYTRNFHVVGDQRVLRNDDLPQSWQHSGRITQHQSDGGQEDAKADDGGVELFITHGAPSLSSSSVSGAQGCVEK